AVGRNPEEGTMPRQPGPPGGPPPSPTPTPASRATSRSISRRTFLKGSAATGVALAGGAVWTTAIQPRRVKAAETPIEHVIVACQENRSFDHYFGYAPQAQAARLGP